MADTETVPTRESVEAELLGRTGLTYTRGGPGDRRHPEPIVYEDCTVKEVIWPGSTLRNDEGEWVAVRLRLRTGDGRQVTTTAMASKIPAGRRG